MTKVLMCVSVGLAVTALALYAAVLTEKLARAEDRAASISAAHAETLRTLDTLAADRARTVAALEALRADEVARAVAETALMKEIDHAPESDDGPVAPVLRRALDGLRR